MAEATSPKFHKIGSLPMCIAVDRSGSTFGSTIKSELDVVEQICHLRHDEKHQPVTLLPWCDVAFSPVSLPDGGVKRRLNGIGADGGTDPAVLYGSDASLRELRAAGIWVLMTDGRIRDTLVENFATKTSEVGLHNKPCIIVVFGNVTSGRPAACDISVGVAIYGVVPDCIFLFHDVPTGIVRILQAKGRFKQLLPKGLVWLVVSQYTTWAELPRISYEDLFRIEVATVRELLPDEIALQEGLIVNLPDMMAGNLDEATVEKILNDRDNRRSIVLASKTKGSGKTLKGWLKAQQKTVPDTHIMLEDVFGRARNAIIELLAAIRGELTETSVADLRGKVRAAHEANLDHYWEVKSKTTDSDDRVRRQNERLERHASALDDSREEPYRAGRCGYKSGSTTPVRHILRQTGSSQWDTSPTGYENTVSRIPTPTKKAGGKNPYRRKGTFSRPAKSSVMSYDGSDTEEQPPLCLAGYRRADAVNQFKGRCMLCHSASVLSLLFKLPPSVETPKFPTEGQGAKIAFPLAMGNFPELDVLSYFVCCDTCADHLVKLGECPTSETIVGAVCLVSLPQNMATMLEAIDQAVRGRFDTADLLAIFIAMLDSRLVQNDLRDAPQVDKDLFRVVARWTLASFSSVLEIPATLSLAFSDGTTLPPLQGVNLLFSKNYFADPGHDNNVDLLLLRYPISGFMVLLRLMRLTQFISDEAASSTQVTIFQRIVFYLLEKEFGRRSTGQESLPLTEMLDLRPETPGRDEDRSIASTSAGLKKSVAIAELIHYEVLDQDSLKGLQSDPEFRGLDKNCGPALAVFLHWLARNGVMYSEPVTCFNVLKIKALKNVVKAPLAISDGLAADYIAKIWGRA
jgi:hypothetical protein